MRVGEHEQEQDSAWGLVKDAEHDDDEKEDVMMILMRLVKMMMMILMRPSWSTSKTPGGRGLFDEEEDNDGYDGQEGCQGCAIVDD